MRAAGDKRFVVSKRYLWKIFEHDVTVAYFKNQPPEVFCKKSAPENLQAWGPKAFLKRDCNTCIFPVKFLKFFRAPILKYIYEPVFLYLQVIREKDTANEA